jgi:glycerophosphoryl diester phosphodiesterase
LSPDLSKRFVMSSGERSKLANLYPHTPIILGHRGASFEAPENTLAAFRLALEQGADGLELDVTLTADGQVVVVHDDTLDRTTNGHGPVSRLSLAEVQALDAGYPARFGLQFAGQRVPTLAEVFAACGEQGILNIELKHDHSPGRRLAGRVVELIHAHGWQSRVILSSFQFSSLGRVKALDPALPVGLLYMAPRFGPRLAECLAGVLPHEAHHPAALGLSAAQVAWFHQHALRVNVWTVDDERELRRLAAAGVDGLITNKPRLAVRALSGG